jgi:phosphatidylserine decarboxylase
LFFCFKRVPLRHCKYRKEEDGMITKYGLPQAAIYPAALIACMAVAAVLLYPSIWIIPVEIVLLALTAWAFSFFRDPPRKIADDENVLYSSCDGTITDISAEGGQIVISMFLSLFNVHVNRAPCSCDVADVYYKRGECRDARDPESSKINESNALTLTRLAEPREKIVVRQVSGAIARHIVCAAKTGDTLRQGERFGMIKFGSRTELIIPGGADREICVKLGDKVKAGLTPLVRYRDGGGC